MPLTSTEVEIRRCRYQRSIRISVHPNGRVQLTAGQSVSQRDLEHFLASHQQWIERSLAKFAEMRRAYPCKQYTPGEEFLFLGRPYKLDFQVDCADAVEIALAQDSIVCKGPEHLLGDAKNLKLHVRNFYQDVGQRILSARVAYFSQKMDLVPKSVSFRSQKTRWGSCSAEKKISLNWRLIVAPPLALDYVVVHELAHIRHHNHSPQFWELVEHFAPNYKAMRRWLRKNLYETDFLAEVSELHSAPQN